MRKQSSQKHVACSSSRDPEPGASAAAEHRRVRRTAVCRRLLRGACATTAAAMLIRAVWIAQPWLASVGMAAGLATWLLKPDPDPDRWRRGAAGEVATAVLLTRLPRRFVVLHDRRVPGSRANIDHLVIGPTGVWVVDSKVYRARLRIRRGAVWAGEYRVPTTPAAWEAERLARLLGVAARAVVAVHADGLRRRGKVIDGVRVIPAQRLCRRLRRGRPTLTSAAVAALAKEARARL